MNGSTRSIARRARGALALGVASAMLALTGCASLGIGPREPITTGIDEAAAAALPQEFRDAGIINVAIDLPYPPFALIDESGGFTGLDVELGYALGEKLGIPVSVKKQAFDSVIPSLQAGVNDLILSGMNDTVERQQVLNFVDYLYAGFSLVVATGNPHNITDMSSLCGLNVGSQKASTTSELLAEQSEKCEAEGKSPVNIIEVPTVNDALTALRAGNVVSTMTDSPIAQYMIDTLGASGQLEVVVDPNNPKGFEPVYTGIGMLKKHEGLEEAIRLAFQAIIDDGTYARLLEKYKMTQFKVEAAGINQATE